MLSPSKDEKRSQKKKDRAAYKTFAVESTNLNRFQQMQQAIIEQKQATHCNVCKIPFFSDTKRKDCGFCKSTVCLDHLRKKRKAGTTWKRICDDCQDRILFENYMKVQIKTEEAIVAHQEIVRLQNQQSRIQLDARVVKMSLLNTQKEYLNGQFSQAQYKYDMGMGDLNSKEQNLNRQSDNIENQHTQMDIVQLTLPRALQYDYQTLKIQDQKITKQLLKQQKRVNQLMQLMVKAEQEVTRAYDVWESKQKQRSGKGKKKDDCLLF